MDPLAVERPEGVGKTPAVSFMHRIQVRLDNRTVMTVDLLASGSSPVRTRSEMIRHLVRLGLRHYDVDS